MRFKPLILQLMELISNTKRIYQSLSQIRVENVLELAAGIVLSTITIGSIVPPSPPPQPLLHTLI